MEFVLTEKQRIEILIFRGYLDKQRSYQEVCNLFNVLYPEKQIKKSTVCRTVTKFLETGGVKRKPGSGRPKTATNDENKLNILLELEENPKTSTTQLALNSQISQKSVRNILGEEKFKPYKITYLHELQEDDPDRRAHFAETIMEKINNNPNFHQKILFSDEATFCLNGQVNRHNCRFWSRDNPRWMSELHTQYPEKVNVWAGILGNHIIGPFFIDGNLTGQKYLDLLRQRIIPEIRNLNENIDDIWYQHDGAPAHFSRGVIEFLNIRFPERWIGRRGTLEWPARSPDMTPLDFFFWGHLKCRVYKDRPNDLRQKILDEAAQITPGMLSNTLAEFYDRLGFCLANDGSHFEHLIK